MSIHSQELILMSALTVEMKRNLQGWNKAEL